MDNAVSHAHYNLYFYNNNYFKKLNLDGSQIYWRIFWDFYYFTISSVVCVFCEKCWKRIWVRLTKEPDKVAVLVDLLVSFLNLNGGDIILHNYL